MTIADAATVALVSKSSRALPSWYSLAPLVNTADSMSTTSGTLLIHGMRGNVWRSTDAGASWTRLIGVTAPASALVRGNGDLLVAGAGIAAPGATSAVSAQAAATPEATAVVEEPEPQYQTEAPWTEELGTGSALPPNIPPWMKTWGPLPDAYGERDQMFAKPLRGLPSAVADQVGLFGGVLQALVGLVLLIAGLRALWQARILGFTSRVLVGLVLLFVGLLSGAIAIGVLMALQCATLLVGLVLAGTDLFYPPLGAWIAKWIAAPGTEPSTLVPYAKEMYDAAAYESMRAFRKPFATLHVYSFYALCVLGPVHIAAVVITELRAGGTLVSAMLTGRKVLDRKPVDE